MRELFPRGRKDSVVLGDVSVNGGFFRGTVDEGVVLVQGSASNLVDGLGDSSREHERLSFRSRGHHFYDSLDVLPETHVQERISFIKHKLRPTE